MPRLPACPVGTAGGQGNIKRKQLEKE